MAVEPTQGSEPEVPVVPEAINAVPSRRNPILRLRRHASVGHLVRLLGPGLITGASDDDPSGIGTYAMVGASQGYTMLWAALFTFPLMAVVQFICAKIGLVAGRGLASVLREHYPKKVLYAVLLALVFINTINAGVDIGAVAAAVNLIVPISIRVLIIPIGLIILALQIWGSYRLITRLFKWLTLALFAYIAAAFFSRPNWGDVLHYTFIPTIHFDVTYLSALVAVLGTTISPYLFFWQADQEAEEKKVMGRNMRLWKKRGATESELTYAFWDTNVGMFFSNIVMYFIILATGATLFTAGQHHIQSATEAAQALRPIAGDASTWLFAIGLIGSGFLAIPILTGSAAYAVAEAFGWHYGLNRQPQSAKHFYAVIAAATIIGMLINFTNINPIDALYWVSVISGFLSPFLLVVIMIVANNKTVMGQHVNNFWTNLFGWATTLIMFAAAGVMVISWLSGSG